MRSGTEVMGRRARGLMLAIAALFVLGIAVAGSAAAHATLVSSSPEDGATVDTLPPAVSLTFSEAVARPAFVAVTAPDGTSVTDGDPSVVDATVTQNITATGEQGTYTMSYRVTSDDGHPVTGTLSFTLTTGAKVAQVDPPKQPGAASDEGSTFDRHSTEALIAVVVVILGIALLIGSGKAARGRDKRG